MLLKIDKIRAEFPALHQQVHGKPLVYLDNGATSQKPQSVIDRLIEYYSYENANVHRGVHYLSQKATSAMEDARENIRQFIGAESVEEIIFTKGTTESINLVAYSFAEKFISNGDEIIVSEMEHHANFVPWQLLCKQKGAVLKVIPVDDNGELELPMLNHLISPKTKIIAVTQVSNALGTVNPVEKIIEIAHKHNIPVLLDGAQAIPHSIVNVTELDCDFYVFSGHKMYAPMGIGILYGKKKWLELMPPYQTGGEMIDYVSAEEITFNVLPFKFEAGTPNVGGILGLDAAIKFMQEIGIENIKSHENDLLNYAISRLSELEDVQIIGNPKHRAGVISMVIKGIHHYDIATIIDQLGIAVRSGHHCAQPIMRRFNIEGTIRISFAVYNTEEEIDIFVHALKRVIGMFK
jgi:cysteine desulfurase / selenocysteine lyase